jgi:NAD(P)-dependent dehydrogenase (short-subunit alcohol dehydrogenase family)
MDLGIEDKVAVIVGGGRGIGYAAACDIAAAGAKVVIADIDADTALAAAARIAADSGAEAMGIAADISSMDSVRAMVAQTTVRFGAPQIVVITAAIVDDKSFLESAPQDWEPMINVCLYGPLNVLHTVLPGMVDAGYGRIVCMATDAARVGQARLSYYAAAKAGVIALVKSVAQEVGPSGVTLNVVSPGATNTELRQTREAALKEQMGEEKYERRVQKVLRMYPTRRLGEPDDHAAIISFLVSERASWITGQVVSVNGGFVMP